ncbi:MAG: hypothetical protein IPK82_38605 [Polyangiaceae bacterium]|nr:hypothetical protein [Polyangiaceae bacterium]
MKHALWLSTVLGVAAAGCGGESFSATEGGAGNGGSTSSSTGQAGSTSSSGGAGGSGGSATTSSTVGTTTSSTTTTTSTGTGGAPPCQPLSEPCTQCAYQNCEALYCACYSSDDCPALVNCLSMCNPDDTTCTQPCLTQHAESISTAFLLGDCAATPCAMDCTGTFVVQPCPKCLFEKCPSEMNSCLSDQDCYDIITCATACAPSDLTCAFACTNGKSQEAIQKAVAVQGCTGDANKCQAACGG